MVIKPASDTPVTGGLLLAARSQQVLTIFEQLVARNSELELQLSELMSRRNKGEGVPAAHGAGGTEAGGSLHTRRDAREALV